MGIIKNAKRANGEEVPSTTTYSSDVPNCVMRGSMHESQKFE